MKIYSRDDPMIKSVLDKISKYTRQAEIMGLSYWVFMENVNPIGILVIGKEPIQLLEPPGVIMAFLYLIDFKQSRGKIREFVSQALRFAIKRKIQYALAYFPFNEKEAIQELQTSAAFPSVDTIYKIYVFNNH